MKNLALTTGSFTEFMNADNIIVAGASLVERGFKGAPVVAGREAELQAYAASLGFTGTLRVVAVSGSVAANALTQITTALNTYAGEKNLVLVHTGGNNVSSSRPFTAGQVAGLNDTFQAIYEVCQDNDALLLHSTISRRFYNTGARSPAGVFDINGSGLYNEFITVPYLKRTQRYPGALDAYDFITKHPELISGDGVHLAPQAEKAFAFWMLDKAADYIGGRTRKVKKGDRIAVANRNQAGFNYASNGFGFNYAAYAKPSVRAVNIRPNGYFLGPVLEGVSYSHSVTNTNGAGGAGLVAINKVTDPQWSSEVLNHFTAIAPADGTAHFRFSGLPPRSTGTATIAASRAAAGTDRRADVTIDGVTVVLDAANDAASNEIIMNFTVTPEGTLDISAAASAGSQFGYIGGIILDIDP